MTHNGCSVKRQQWRHQSFTVTGDVTSASCKCDISSPDINNSSGFLLGSLAVLFFYTLESLLIGPNESILC